MACTTPRPNVLNDVRRDSILFDAPHPDKPRPSRASMPEEVWDLPQAEIGLGGYDTGKLLLPGKHAA